MRIRLVSPEEVQATLALGERHGATDYDGRGPPTETSVGLRQKRFESLAEDLLELLVTLQPQRLNFYGCQQLAAFPAGIPAHILPAFSASAFSAWNDIFSAWNDIVPELTGVSNQPSCYPKDSVS